MRRKGAGHGNQHLDVEGNCEMCCVLNQAATSRCSREGMVLPSLYRWLLRGKDMLRRLVLFAELVAPVAWLVFTAI